MHIAEWSFLKSHGKNTNRKKLRGFFENPPFSLSRFAAPIISVRFVTCRCFYKFMKCTPMPVVQATMKVKDTEDNVISQKE